ncbi:MAG TPA: hypothetical protein VFX16_25440 [Pseudonocardiaceae bacterium]|nr:hypothetical protein [Pseudonocardiaceae bacterium]
MLARLGGQGRVALGAILGAVVAASCVFGLLSIPDADTAHADEGFPQAMTGVSAAAAQLGTGQPLPGAAAAAAVPTTTTPPPPPPPKITTTTPPPTTTHVKPTLPTFPPFPTFPSPPTRRHHCHRTVC